MIFRQLFDSVSSTYTYILGCENKGEAIIIDPVYELHARDVALLKELNLKVKYTVDTHVHADHVTGSWLIKESEGAQIAISEHGGAANVDIALTDGAVLSFGEHSVTCVATPGHTNGCMTFVTNDKSMAFTGDCLLIRAAGRTDFQAGNVQTMWHSIKDIIFALPDDCLIYPGHDYQGRTVSTVAEEKQFNPRIGGEAREEDFAGYMNNLGLPHPKQIDIAVPANMVSGKPESDDREQPGWGPVSFTFAGIPEVEPDWVARHLNDVSIIDVRSEVEFHGDMGHIAGSVLIPLDELRDRLEEIPSGKPVVAICQSGKRSAMAVEILKSAGIDEIANIPGGLINWSRLSLPGIA